MEYLTNRDKTVADFNKNYSKELTSLEQDIKNITDLFLLLLSKNPKYCLVEKSEYLILILRSVDYLISATYLAKQRAIFEMGNVVRLSIETASVAIHIHSSNYIFENYKQDKYDSTKAIKYAKAHIKNIGELWGVLSRTMVHPNTYHGILSKQIENNIIETGIVNLGFKEKNEIQDKTALLLLRISANIIFKSFQLIVSKKDTYKGISGQYYESINQFAFGKDIDDIIKDLFDELKTVHNNLS